MGKAEEREWGMGNGGSPQERESGIGNGESVCLNACRVHSQSQARPSEPSVMRTVADCARFPIPDSPFPQKPRFPKSMRRTPVLAVAIALTLSACTVGPEYVRPEAQMAPAFDQAPGDAYLQTAAVSSVWASFKEPELDALIARALAANTTIAQACFRRPARRSTPRAAIPAAKTRSRSKVRGAPILIAPALT